MSRVVILSGHSIFAEGVAARLKQYLEAQSLATVDLAQANALEQVIALKPAFIILDAGETALDQLCNIGSLLTALPALTLIRLDPEQNHAQVVVSQERALTQVQELVEVINAN